MGKTRKPVIPIPKPEDVFRAGVSFEHASRLLTNDVHSTLGGLETGQSAKLFAFVPAIVNAAFTAEIYLKCLIILDGSTLYQGHRLDELFGDLMPPTTTRLRTIFNFGFPRSPPLFGPEHLSLES